MLHEHKFDLRSKGLICGPSLIITDSYRNITPIIKDKKRFVQSDNYLQKKFCAVVQGWRVYIKARESDEYIWQRNFNTQYEAIVVWCHLLSIDNNKITAGDNIQLPSFFIDGELEYHFAQTTTFNTSNSTALPWNQGGNICPFGVTSVDYCVIAGGGNGALGGGGAGGMKQSTGLSVTPGTSYTITVGGSAANSVFSSVTSTAGGAGGSFNQGGFTGGSGGGGGINDNQSNASLYPGGSGTSGEGNAGGNPFQTSSPNGLANGGGGGGKNAVGGTSANGKTGGTGGDGLATTIDSVVRAGGGGGGATTSGSGATGGNGGSGGGATGGYSNNGTGTAATTPTANTGGGGGGGATGGPGGSGAATSSNGATGVVILSYTPQTVNFNMPNLGM